VLILTHNGVNKMTEIEINNIDDAIIELERVIDTKNKQSKALEKKIEAIKYEVNNIMTEIESLEEIQEISALLIK
jgi:predicted  nucleic acid-binding Zn-ribbon protein